MYFLYLRFILETFKVDLPDLLHVFFKCTEAISVKAIISSLLKVTVAPESKIHLTKVFLSVRQIISMCFKARFFYVIQTLNVRSKLI